MNARTLASLFRAAAPRAPLCTLLVAGSLAASLGCGPPSLYVNPDGSAGDAGTGDGAATDAMRVLEDPRGTDATFNFTWRVNGVDPSDPRDPCTAANVRFLRMTVVDASMVERHYDQFRFDCRLGRYRSTMPELRAGTYRVYWEAIDTMGARASLASGTLDAMGNLQPELQTLEVVRGRHVDFDESNRPDGTFMGAPTNFATASAPFDVRLRFARAGGGAAGTCAEAGVARVEYLLRLSNNVPMPGAAGMPMAGARLACDATLETLRWPRLNHDLYRLELRGFDAMGAQRWQGRCEHVHTIGSTGPFECLAAASP